MQFFTTFITIFLFISCPLQTISQSHTINKFTTSNGLLSNSINDCNYDKNGFLWIATQAGLSRFDGQKFVNYTTNNYKEIKSNRFKCIYKLNSGNLIVRNSCRQFFIINEQSELRLLNNWVYGEDYLETSDKKIYFLQKNDPLKGKIDPLVWEEQYLFYLTEDASAYKIYKDLLVYNNRLNVPLLGLSQNPTHSFVIKNNFYTILKNNQLLVFNKGKLIQSYQLEKILNLKINRLKLNVSSNNQLLSLNVNNQLYTISEFNNVVKFEKVEIQPDKDEILTKVNFFQKNISIFYSDINGVYIQQPQLFKITGLGDNVNQNKWTYRIIVKNDSTVYSSQHFPAFSHLNSFNSGSLIFNLNKDIVCLFNPKKVTFHVKNKLINYKLDFNNQIIKQNDYRDVLLKDDKVYIITNHQILEFKQPNKMKPIFYTSSAITSTCLMEDKKYWLVGTNNNGIFKYNTQNNTYTVLNQFINKDIRYIKYDSLINKYWVFTYGSGIYWMDSLSNTTPFQKDNNNHLDFAHYYLNDTLGNYWIACNNGLFKFDKSEITKLIKNPVLKVHYHYYKIENGFASNELNGGFSNSGVVLPNKNLAFSSKEGVVIINPYKFVDYSFSFPIIIDKVIVNDKPVPLKSNYEIKEGYFTFELLVSSSNYDLGIASNIEYQIPELNLHWESLDANKLKLYSLNNGKYHINLRKVGELDQSKSKIIILDVLPPWYATNKAYVIYLLTFLFLLFVIERLISFYRRKKIKKELQLIESELKALRAQINPHYLSNSLVGLQNSIMDGDFEKSIKFISTFNKVMRNILYNSENSITTVENEIKIIKDYVALENINRDQIVQLYISKEFNLFHKLTELYMPTNVLQPLIENAFIHGFSDLLNRSLFIQIKINVNTDNLIIEIIDNGKGYYPSETKRDSFGLKNLKLVIQQLQVKFNKTLEFEIANRTDAQGTIVHLTLPLITNNNDKKQA